MPAIGGSREETPTFPSSRLYLLRTTAHGCPPCVGQGWWTCGGGSPSPDGGPKLGGCVCVPVGLLLQIPQAPALVLPPCRSKPSSPSTPCRQTGRGARPSAVLGLWVQGGILLVHKAHGHAGASQASAGAGGVAEHQKPLRKLLSSLGGGHLHPGLQLSTPFPQGPHWKPPAVHLRPPVAAALAGEPTGRVRQPILGLRGRGPDGDSRG